MHVRKKERGNVTKMQCTIYILVYQKCLEMLVTQLNKSSKP